MQIAKAHSRHGRTSHRSPLITCADQMECHSLISYIKGALIRLHCTAPHCICTCICTALLQNLVRANQNSAKTFSQPIDIPSSGRETCAEWLVLPVESSPRLHHSILPQSTIMLACSGAALHHMDVTSATVEDHHGSALLFSHTGIWTICCCPGIKRLPSSP